MLCPNCKIPMKAIDGLESNFVDDKIYEISEIKYCSDCGQKVKEIYKTYKCEEIFEEIKYD